MTDSEVQDELQKVAKSYNSDAEFNAALASQNIDRATLEKNLYETLLMSKYVDETIDKKIVVTQKICPSTTPATDQFIRSCAHEPIRGGRRVLRKS